MIPFISRHTRRRIGSAHGLLACRDYVREIGEGNLFQVRTRAIAVIYPRLDSEICRSRRARIFRECHIALPNGKPVPGVGSR
jgi:SulP family sulfate permease